MYILTKDRPPNPSSNPRSLIVNHNAKSQCINQVRPVVNTMYYVIDLEPTPIEPNLVRIRRERQRKAATCLQYACK
jgi:hypothetical protein